MIIRTIRQLFTPAPDALWQAQMPTPSQFPEVLSEERIVRPWTLVIKAVAYAPALVTLTDQDSIRTGEASMPVSPRILLSDLLITRAVKWDTTGVAVYFFPRGSIPADITAETPLPDNWGRAQARWPAAACDPFKFFNNHNAIFDTTLW